jgi:hypothetical protein
MLRRAALTPDSVLAIGSVEIRVTPGAGAADADRVRRERAASGSSRLRMAVLALLVVACGAVLYMKAHDKPEVFPAAPDLFAAKTAACPTMNVAQAGPLALDKRVAADGKRERHPFYVEEGLEAVNLYEQASACFRVAGDMVRSDEVAALARQMRREVIDGSRIRRLRLERSLLTSDKEVAVREVVALRALYLSKQGPFLTWINGVARKLDVDKE